MKNDKNKYEIGKDKNIYIIREENDENKPKEEEEEIIYTEIIYDYDKYEKYPRKFYLRKEETPEKDENEKIIYLIKYNKLKRPIENEKIVYIILEEEENKDINKDINKDKVEDKNIDYLPISNDLKQIIKEKQLIYLIKSDKDKKNIDKNKKLYKLKDEIRKPNKSEEIIYEEIIYEYIKNKEYMQIIYLKTKEIIERAEDENIIYLIKYEKDKQNIEEKNIIFNVLDKEKDEEKIVEENIDEITKDKEKDKNIYFFYIFCIQCIFPKSFFLFINIHIIFFF